MDAKSEVLERKRELDMTKEKMDKLVEQLCQSREKAMQWHLPGPQFQPWMMGMSPAAAGFMLPPIDGDKSNGQALIPHQGTMFPPGLHPPHTVINELPSSPPKKSGVGGTRGSQKGPASNTMQDPMMLAPRFSGDLGYMGSMGPGYMGMPPGMFMGGGYGPMYTVGATNTALQPSSGPQTAYGHVQSKYAQSAAKYSQANSERAQSQRQDGIKQAKPDRFSEGKKTEAMVAAMARRWQ